VSVQYLGVKELSSDAAVLEHVLPQAGRGLSQTAIEAGILPLLHRLITTPSSVAPAVVDALRATAFVPISSDPTAKVAPQELYDARNQHLRQLLGADGPYPAAS
jgi:hypothetical protein